MELYFFLSQEEIRVGTFYSVEKKTEKIYWNLLLPLEIRWGRKERIR